MNGKFRLRIEDTDKERSTPESVRQILSGLKWLGLDWDDDVIYQGERLDRHREIVQDLLNSNHVYRCFCSPDELEKKRKHAEQNKINKRYDGTCRNLSSGEIEAHLEKNTAYSVRFKIQTRTVTYTDIVHGEHHADLTDMDDFIIQRSDGTPVYQLAVVADDHDMDIDLVLRGDDHLSNTIKQIQIYQAMDWEVPKFGHMPLILGQDKVRLSKRHGASSVEEFKKEGILPDALFNYLCLLGWNPGTEQEKMSRDEIVDLFQIERINNTPAVFDRSKLNWLNARYIAEMPFDQLLDYADSWIKENNFTISEVEEERFLFYLKLMQVRCKTLIDLYDALQIYFKTPQNYDERGTSKVLKKDGVKELLADLQNMMIKLSSSSYDDIHRLEEEIRTFAEKRDISAAKVIHPLRMALTGKMESAGIFDLIYILGKDKVVERIRNVLDYLPGLEE
jgi:glutamyl-tRNA synthetase